MYTRRALLLTVVAASLAIGHEAQPSIQVAGAVNQPLTLAADDLAKMPRVHTSRNRMETYEGVWLHEALKRAGLPQGSELRDKPRASYVLAEAQDRCQASFSLGVSDPAFLDEILLADAANGNPLFSAAQRRLVAPKGKPGAPSVRTLTRFEVVEIGK